MEMKGVTCKIPQELHAKITEEIRTSGSTMSKFIEMVINSYYDNKEKGAINMGKMRTMAFQVSEELFQRIKNYLDEYERVYGRKLTQKEFVIGLVEQALEEAEEEFEAARAALGEADAEQDESHEANDGEDADEDEAGPDEGGESIEAEVEPDGNDEPDEVDAEPENSAIPEVDEEPAEEAVDTAE